MLNLFGCNQDKTTEKSSLAFKGIELNSWRSDNRKKSATNNFLFDLSRSKM